MMKTSKYWAEVAAGFVAVLLASTGSPVRGDEPKSTSLPPPLMHWALADDLRDASPHERHLTNRGVRFEPVEAGGLVRTSAVFDGRAAHAELSAERAPTLGTSDFAISAWILADESGDDLPGDILSQYDEAAQRGFHLSLKTNTGVTFNQPNVRQLQFGIDNAGKIAWTDCGRPGNALLAFALASHQGELFAGTCEPGKDESGRVYRYGGDQKWIDCGAPDNSNSVTAMATFEDRLYVGTGKYRVAGSSLPESENTNLGGRIFRYESGRWESCGRIPGAEAVSGMLVYRGQLYAASLYKPAGFYRYAGGENWIDCGVPNGLRVESLGLYNGFIYATTYDGGRVARYDGREWTDCGQLGDAQENTQTYGFAVYQGKLYCGTWRTGRVYRFEDLNQWTDVGRLGEELEVMGMVVHNGRMLAGTLPTGNVYQYRRQVSSNAGGKSESGDEPNTGQHQWELVGELDPTPNVRYRRAWTFAEHDGRLFCGVLPSGKIWSCEVGQQVAWNASFPAGWHHVAAIRARERLQLFVDGKLVAARTLDPATPIDLSSQQPWRLGWGANDYFRGRIADVRLFGQALNADQVGELAAAQRERK